MKETRTNIVIKGIKWERIFLHFDVACDACEGEKNFFIGNSDGERYPLNAERTEGGYEVVMNTVCVHDREFLENGRWHLYASPADPQSPEGPKEAVLTITPDAAYTLDDKSRVFRYAEDQMAYTITFGVKTPDEERLELYIDSYFLEENKNWKKRRYVREVRSPRDKAKRVLMTGAIKSIAAYYHTVHALLPKTGKRVLIMSETHDYLWGNLKYIDAEIKKRGLDSKYKIKYSFRKKVGKHQSAKDIPSWVKATTKVAASDIIFVDDYAPIFGFFELAKDTKLIQVWHSGEGFKSVGYSRFGKEGSPFPQKSCHKQYTHAVTGSEHLVHVFEEVFGIEPEAFMPLGMPRMDGFLDGENIERCRKEFYEAHPETAGKKLILFAPTYRGAEQKEAYYDYSKLDLARIDEFCRRTGSVWAFKMHPFTREMPAIPEEYADTIIDITACRNINDLYYVTDVLVTDYSSNFYEYALLGRPVVFYTYARVMYELTRGVHRCVRENAPGKVCDTFDELMACLEAGDYEIEKTQQFVKDNYGDYTGDASAKVIDAIFGE